MQTYQGQIAAGGKRNRAIDVAKGLGIILVVFAHLNYIEPLQSIIYGFHMPLFFIISGMLFNPGKYPKFSSFFKQRMKTLVCPYILFSGISLILYSLVLLYPDGFTPVNNATILSWFIQIFYAQYSKMMFNIPLWFVPCLFLTEIIYFFVVRIKQKNLFWIVAAGITAFGWYATSSYCPVDFSILPWNFTCALFALCFYAIGNKIYPLILAYPLKTKPLTLPLIVMILCFAVEIPLALYKHVSIGSRVLGNGFVFYLTGILGTIGIMILSTLLEKNCFLSFCGKNSFQIMATHKLFQTIIFAVYKVVFSTSLEESPNYWIPSIIIFLIDMAMCIAFSYLYSNIKSSYIK